MFLYFAAPLTVLLFFMSKKLYSIKPWPLFNPVLITIFSLISILVIFNLPYAEYQQGTRIITSLLEPAIVALALPLYLQLHLIKAQFKLILIACFIAVIVAFSCAFYLMPLMGADLMTSASIAAQSVTTPNAMEISKSINGIV